MYILVLLNLRAFANKRLYPYTIAQSTSDSRAHIARLHHARALIGIQSKHAHLYSLKQAHKHIHTHLTQLRKHTHIRTNMRAHSHTSTHTHIPIYTHMYTHGKSYVHLLYKHTRSHTHTHTHTHTHIYRAYRVLPYRTAHEVQKLNLLRTT